MKYILITKDILTQNKLSEVEYSSLRKISIELKTTYCSVYECFLYNEALKKAPKKLSQVRFNQQYKIVSVAHQMSP